MYNVCMYLPRVAKTPNTCPLANYDNFCYVIESLVYVLNVLSTSHCEVHDPWYMRHDTWYVVLNIATTVPLGILYPSPKNDWNLLQYSGIHSGQDTLGKNESVLISEASWFLRLNCAHKRGIWNSNKCPVYSAVVFQGVLIGLYSVTYHISFQ